ARDLGAPPGPQPWGCGPSARAMARSALARADPARGRVRSLSSRGRFRPRTVEQWLGDPSRSESRGPRSAYSRVLRAPRDLLVPAVGFRNTGDRAGIVGSDYEGRPADRGARRPPAPLGGR